ncbi:CoA-binding protein [Alteribacillus sp. HJP-4]|uniref:CoA-binding protein n=1 Tax=Alteribacillus sp. HJP-4 TaxID=2775394 RepID=UPI0035CCE7B9
MTTIKNPSQEEIKDILNRSRRIAVVGLSNNPERTSYQVSKVMQEAGYEILPVNPTIKEALGQPAYASLTEIEGPVDIINVFRRSEHLPEVAEEAAGLDCEVFWAQLGLSNEKAYETANGAGMTVIMDKCIKVEYQRIK